VTARPTQLDAHFAAEVMERPGGKHLLTCMACGTCASVCLVRRFYPSFNPRRVLHQASLGMREAVLSSPEIWLCSACDACYPRCPQEIHISEVMGALRDLAIEAGYEAPGPFPVVDSAVCSGCAVCARVCPYEAMAPARDEADPTRQTAHVDHTRCLHCGLCVAACPSGAISLEETNDQEILARVTADGWMEQRGLLSGGTQPRCLAFVCQWSIRSDAAWERAQRFGDQVRLVPLPCSGRVEPAMVLWALSRGVDAVLVVGCDDDECHYQRGTYIGRSKVYLLREMLATMGYQQERVRFARQASADRYGLERHVQEMLATITILTAPIAVTVD
jgi:heterodisulfide reductase subunit C/coenzyme F420-reducing hydrogenase delta subunit